MFNYQPLLDWMNKTPEFQAWGSHLLEEISHGLSLERWGDLPAWEEALASMPIATPSSFDLVTEARIGSSEDCSDQTRELLRTHLMVLHPWRKGPWSLFGLNVDTEWRSDWKWDRLAPHLGDISGHHVLDVGCGNGYHCMRLYGAGANRVIGIDPSAKFVCQFQAFKRYLPAIPVDVLPLGIENMPSNLRGFDTVLSMGVIYHRRDPVNHIRELMACLKPGGQLVLETLIVEGDDSLIPAGRYAKMRNVWCVPTPQLVLSWLTLAKTKSSRMVDLCPTSTAEQRATDWMQFESLSDFLDPANPAQTIEGYPAPKRAIFIAEV